MQHDNNHIVRELRHRLVTWKDWSEMIFRNTYLGTWKIRRLSKRWQKSYSREKIEDEVNSLYMNGLCQAFSSITWSAYPIFSEVTSVFTQSCLQRRSEVLSASYLWLAVTLDYVSHFTIPAFQLWDTNYCQHIFLSYHKYVLNKPNKYCLNCVTAVGGSSRWAMVSSFIRVLPRIWELSSIPIFPIHIVTTHHR